MPVLKFPPAKLYHSQKLSKTLGLKSLSQADQLMGPNIWAQTQIETKDVTPLFASSVIALHQQDTCSRAPAPTPHKFVPSPTCTPPHIDPPHDDWMADQVTCCTFFMFSCDAFDLVQLGLHEGQACAAVL